jgi:hypothetical protein
MGKKVERQRNHGGHDAVAGYCHDRRLKSGD